MVRKRVPAMVAGDWNTITVLEPPFAPSFEYWSRTRSVVEPSFAAITILERVEIVFALILSREARIMDSASWAWRHKAEANNINTGINNAFVFILSSSRAVYKNWPLHTRAKVDRAFSFFPSIYKFRFYGCKQSRYYRKTDKGCYQHI